MNRKEAAKLVRAMGLPLSALEKIELIEFMFSDAFDRAQKTTVRRFMMPKEHSFDTLNEIALEGAQITRGMRLLYSVDARTNPRDLTNYYQNT